MVRRRGKLIQLNLHKQTPLYNGHFFLVPADSPYIASCLNLTTTVKATKACPQPAKLPLDNDQFFQRLTKESEIAMKFDVYGVLMMNIAAVIILIVLNLYYAVDCPSYLKHMLLTLLVLSC